MFRRVLVSLLLLALGSAGLTATGSAAQAHPSAYRGAVAVSGDVATPTTYSAEELRELPQLTLPNRRGGSVRGASLETLVEASDPTVDPSARNGQLRVSVTVIGSFGRASTFTLGELNSGFGNRPALLVPGRSGTDLIVPGDSSSLRTVTGVRQIVVAVAQVGATEVAEEGSLTIVGPHRSVTLSAELLAALPARTVTVEFLSGGSPTTRIQRGPELWLVLLVAGIVPGPRTVVAATATDGYVGTVTPFEVLTGGRQLLLSLNEDGVALTQPRLVVKGDIRGGRNVTGVTELNVSRGW